MTPCLVQCQAEIVAAVRATGSAVYQSTEIVRSRTVPPRLEVAFGSLSQGLWIRFHRRRSAIEMLERLAAIACRVGKHAKHRVGRRIPGLQGHDPLQSHSRSRPPESELDFGDALKRRQVGGLQCKS